MKKTKAEKKYNEMRRKEYAKRKRNEHRFTDNDKAGEFAKQTMQRMFRGLIE